MFSKNILFHNSSQHSDLGKMCVYSFWIESLLKMFNLQLYLKNIWCLMILTFSLYSVTANAGAKANVDTHCSLDYLMVIWLLMVYNDSIINIYSISGNGKSKVFSWYCRFLVDIQKNLHKKEASSQLVIAKMRTEICVSALFY